MMFQDGMVLQRDKRISIWGTADPGADVRVVMQDMEENTSAGRDGKWAVCCGPFRTSFKEDMFISSGTECIWIHDVAVGEVWLAGGQSNMEFPMRFDEHLVAEKDNQDSFIRFFDYPEVAYTGQIEEADYSRNYGFWRFCEPDQLERFSAVGYYFAKKIRQQYDVPIGIIGCNWGGTPACAWMSEEAICSCGGKTWIEDYQSAIRNLDMDKYASEFRSNPWNYKTDLAADPMFEILEIGYPSEVILKKVDEAGLNDALTPAMGPYSERRPAGLYHSMLCEVAPYGIRGVIWYQGEADDEKAEIYHRMFPALIQCWRDLWQEDLPFLFVQLAPFGHWLACRGTRYPEIRAAQQWTADHVRNTAMAVISDSGSEWDIHPKNKQPVGERLALLAEHYVYGEDILCEAPGMTEITVGKGIITLFFEHAGEGLQLQEKRLDSLEIYQGGYPVDYDSCVASGNTVLISGNKIRPDLPTEVRLGWTAYHRMNLKNSAGIPARPAIVCSMVHG